MDDDGFWYILGRSDDTMKVAGKRLGPAEVESAAQAHPAVAEAAAIGVPDAVKGEAIVCFAVLVPGIEPSNHLAEEVKQSVAHHLGKALAPENGATRPRPAEDEERQNPAQSHPGSLPRRGPR